MQITVNEDRLQAVVLAWLMGQKQKKAGMDPMLKALRKILPAGLDQGRIEGALSRSVDTSRVQRIPPKTKKGKPAFELNAAGEVFVRQTIGTGPNDELLTLKLLIEREAPLRALDCALPPTVKLTAAALGKFLHLAICVRHFDLPIPLAHGLNAGYLAMIKLALARSNGVEPDQIYLNKLPTGGVLLALIAGPLVDQRGNKAKDLAGLLSGAALNIVGVTDAKKLPAALFHQWLLAPSERGPANQTDSQQPSPAFDLAIFSANVLAAARALADADDDGVSNLRDKVLIAACWRKYQEMYGPIALEQFKSQLLGAQGKALSLVKEDLIPEERRREFEESLTRRGTSELHYVLIDQNGMTHANAG